MNPPPPDSSGHLTLSDRLERIEAKLDEVAVRIPTVSELERRVTTLEAWQSWAMRIVVGAVITALVGVVIATQ